MFSSGSEAINVTLTTNRVFHRTIVAVLIGYWMILFAGTHWPVPPQPGIRYSDKILHFTAYLGLGFLLSWAVMSFRPQVRGVWQVMATVACYGVFDELTQSLIPSRSMEFADWIADICGESVGLMLYLVTWRIGCVYLNLNRAMG